MNNEENVAIGDGRSNLTLRMTAQHRSNELQLLQAALTKALNGFISGVFISGSSGCGRSFLLDAFEEHLVADDNKGYCNKRPFVCRGKFEINMNSTSPAAEPFLSIISVLEQLMNQLETESKDSNVWKKRIREALEFGFVETMEEIIPGLGRLLSNKRRRPSMAMQCEIDVNLDGYISGERDWGFERFRLACRGIIRAVSKHHPVVILLDNVHGAECDTLEILRTILQDGQPGLQLLIVGTHNSVPDDHELWKVVQSIRPNHINNIRLSAYRPEDLKRVLSSQIQSKQSEIAPFVEYVYRITQGCTIMIFHLFKYLQIKKLLNYFPNKDCFTCNFEVVLQLEELKPLMKDPGLVLKTQLDGFDESQRLVLLTLALLGSSAFHIEILDCAMAPNEQVEAIECDASRPNLCLTCLIGLNRKERIQKLVAILKTLANQGFIKEPSSCFTDFSSSFALYRIHDITIKLVKEYSIADPQIEKNLHLQLGRRLSAMVELSKEAGTFLEESVLFNCVHQSNLASDMIEDKWELADLVNKNYDASEVAALKYAYHTSLKYASTGIALLGSSWEKENYAVMLKLENAISRMYLYCGQIDESLRVAGQIISMAENFDDKQLAYRTKLFCLMSRKDQSPALKFCVDVLEELGHSFPKKGLLKAHATRVVSPVRRLVRSRSCRKIPIFMSRSITSENSGDIEGDTYWADVCDLMVSLGDISVEDESNLHFMFAMARLLQITTSEGRIQASALSFVYWGCVLAQTGEYDEAVRFGKVGLQYTRASQLPGSERCNARAKVMFHKFIDHWARPLHDCLDAFSESMADLRIQGAYDIILPEAATSLEMSFLSSRPLSKLVIEMETVSELLQDYKAYSNEYSHHGPFFQFISNLRGANDCPTILDGTYIEGFEFVSKCKASGDDVALQMYYLCTALLALFFNELELADEMCQCMWDESECGPDFMLPLRVFITGATGFLMARIMSVTRSKCSRHWKQRGETALKRFNKWGNDSLANCLHFQSILVALRLALKSHSSSLADTRTAFDTAISNCAKGKFVQFQALTCELACHYFLEHDQVQLHNQYLFQARVLYREWECSAKVEDLDSAYVTNISSSNKSIEGCLSEESSTNESTKSSSEMTERDSAAAVVPMAAPLLNGGYVHITH